MWINKAKVVLENEKLLKLSLNRMNFNPINYKYTLQLNSWFTIEQNSTLNKDVDYAEIPRGDTPNNALIKNKISAVGLNAFTLCQREF